MSADCICNHCKTVSKALECFHRFCPSQEVRLFLTEEHNQRGNKKRKPDGLQQNCTKEKGFLKFLRRTQFVHYQLCDEVKSGELLSFVQYVMRFRKYLQLFFVIFPLIFKNNSVDQNDNGKLMKQFRKKSFVSQSQIALISSFRLQRGSLITLLQLFFKTASVSFVQKNTASLNTLQWGVPTTLYTELIRQQNKVARTKFPV